MAQIGGGAVFIAVRKASADSDLPATLECCPIGYLKKANLDKSETRSLLVKIP